MTEFVCKSSRDPAVVALYEEHPYLVAYAKHTDLRVAQDPHGAIGGLWDEYGDLCLEFLKAQGLEPYHRLLDFGCGTGRLARKAAPYLNPRNYWGCDISRKAIEHAEQLAVDEGFNYKQPMFIWGHAPLPPADFIWAFSVMIHLPEDEVRAAFSCIASLMHRGSRFLFSYVLPQNGKAQRTGLKQFKHPWELYEESAANVGLDIVERRVWDWKGKQDIALAQKART